MSITHQPVLQVFVLMNSGFVHGVFGTYEAADAVAKDKFSDSPEVQILERSILLVGAAPAGEATREDGADGF